MNNQKVNKFKGKNYSKGQKIAAALYLVTEHLHESDPLRTGLRSHAGALGNHQDIRSAQDSIVHLLAVGVLSGNIHEQNAQILREELERLVHNLEEVTIAALFADASDKQSLPPHAVRIKDINPIKDIYSQTDKKESNQTSDNKNKRQGEILNYIDTYKSAGIKDISKLFSDISEKTIQRELNNLVQLGKITKRGNKRWSVYMAVAS